MADIVIVGAHNFTMLNSEAQCVEPKCKIISVSDKGKARHV